MLLGASILGNMLTGKGVERAGKGVARTEAIYSIRVIWVKTFSFSSSFK